MTKSNKTLKSCPKKSSSSHPSQESLSQTSVDRDQSSQCLQKTLSELSSDPKSHLNCSFQDLLESHYFFQEALLCLARREMDDKLWLDGAERVQRYFRGCIDLQFKG